MPISRRLILLAILTMPLVLLAADPVRKAVAIKDMKFQPETVEIKVGDTIVWTNSDDRDHTVSGSGFKSENLKPGATYSHQFTKAGQFEYACTYHPRMKGTVKVLEK